MALARPLCVYESTKRPPAIEVDDRPAAFEGIAPLAEGFKRAATPQTAQNPPELRRGDLHHGLLGLGLLERQRELHGLGDALVLGGLLHARAVRACE